MPRVHGLEGHMNKSFSSRCQNFIELQHALKKDFLFETTTYHCLSLDVINKVLELVFDSIVEP